MTSDEVGLAVTRGGQELGRLRWDEVKEVVAFKEDELTVDEIWLGFRTTDADDYTWVSEEYAGFHEMESHLAHLLPGFDSGWFARVAHPAFAPNWTTLYGTPRVAEGGQ